MKTFLAALLVLFATRGWSLNPTHFTITQITAPYFIVDGNSPATINKCYVGFEVKNNSNSGVTYTGLKFTITSIGTSVVGQNYAVVSPASGVINVGTLAPGQSKLCYYYVSYPANVTPQATFNIQLSDNTASPKTQSFVIRNRSCISANAGGTATQSFSNQDLIGGTVTDDVTYAVGNVQNGDESDFQVAVSSSFDPTTISLLNTQVIASTVPGIPVGTTDSLYFITGNGSTGATVTIRWTFRITSYNFTNYLLPCAGSTSGSTNYKYALNTSLGAGTPLTVSAAANPLTITKASDQLLYGVSSAAVFTITIQNPGAYGVTVDKIVDQVPAGFTFQSLHASSQITAANSTSVPAAGATGTITFEGGVSSGANTSYYVPAGGSIMVKYNATSASSTTLNLITSAKDYIGITLVGSALNTVSVSTTLPVTLISFKASPVKEGVKLEWVTSGEVNSKLFDVERKKDNASFNSIGKVSASGLSSVNISYSFIDSFPGHETNDYRLKMIDQDQQYKYSPVVSVNYGGKGVQLATVYPNPFTDHTSITVFSDKKQPVRLGIYDLNGKLILIKDQVTAEGTTILLIDQLGSLSPGTYLLQLSTAEGKCEQKIIKR